MGRAGEADAAVLKDAVFMFLSPDFFAGSSCERHRADSGGDCASADNAASALLLERSLF